MPPELTDEDSETRAATLDESASAPEAEPEPPRRRPRRRNAAIIVGGPLLVSAAVVTVLVTRFHTAFLINDDATLSAIVNGDYTGKHSSSLVVAPAMFGHILRLGYAMFPNVPWYGIFLYALQIVAWAVIGTVVYMLRRRPPLAERILVAGVILALLPWMILRVSFTPTSLLIGTVGILVFAVAARVPGRVGVAYAVLAGVLLGASSLLRLYSFLAVVVLFAPVLAVIAIKAGVRRSAVFAVVVGVCVLVGLGTSRLEYSRSAEWREFMKTNKARSSLHDTPRIQHVNRIDLEQIGWTNNDLFLFAEFIYPDPVVYSDHAIRTLPSLSPRIRRDKSPTEVFDALVHDSSDRPADKGPILASLVFIGALLALRWNRLSAAVTLVSAVWFVGVLIVLLLYVRLPGRVLIPLEGGAVLLTAVVPAYLTSSPPRTSTRWRWTSAVVVALVALLVAGPAWHGVRSTARISRENQRGVEARKAVLDRLEALDPSGVFVARGDLLGRFAEPLSSDSAFANPKVIPLGWATNSPLFKARLARLHIDDLYTALRTDPHVYLLGSSLEAYRMAVFYRQHRDVKVGFKARMRTLPLYVGTQIVYWTVWRAYPIETPTPPPAGTPAPAPTDAP